VRRRALLGGAAAAGGALALAGLVSACALSPSRELARRTPVLGFLSNHTERTDQEDAFFDGLRDLGWIEGQNLMVEYRWGGTDPELLTRFAAELVNLGVDVLVSVGTIATVPAKRATSTLPIVMVSVSDPVGTGLVASLARPGGNLTGTGLLSPELAAKRVELLKEVVPSLSRVVVLFDLANDSSPNQLRETEAAAQGLGVQVRPAAVRAAADLDGVFEDAKAWGANGLLLLSSALLVSLHGAIASRANSARLPVIFANRDGVDGGGLISYGNDRLNRFRRSATYADRILRGAAPGELPIEQPTGVEVVVNARTAREQGIAIPPSVAVQVTDWVE